MGFIRHFGFILPLSIAFDLRKDGARNGWPTAAVCSKCHKWKAETYGYGWYSRICRDDLVDTVRVQTWRTTPIPRSVESAHPVEDQTGGGVELDPWWDRQLS